MGLWEVPTTPPPSIPCCNHLLFPAMASCSFYFMLHCATYRYIVIKKNSWSAYLFICLKSERLGNLNDKLFQETCQAGLLQMNIKSNFSNLINRKLLALIAVIRALGSLCHMPLPSSPQVRRKGVSFPSTYVPYFPSLLSGPVINIPLSAKSILSVIVFCFVFVGALGCDFSSHQS